jgi:hypothetical protein
MDEEEPGRPADGVREPAREEVASPGGVRR